MISIDYSTFIITIPQSYLTLLSGVTYELDINQLRQDLKDLEDDSSGMPFPKTHTHNTEYTVSGTTYARAVIIQPPYTVSFEDTGTDYVVSCVGANHNLADILNGTNVNLIINNAAGLIVTSGGGDTSMSKLIASNLVA